MDATMQSPSPTSDGRPAFANRTPPAQLSSQTSSTPASPLPIHPAGLRSPSPSAATAGSDARTTEAATAAAAAEAIGADHAEPCQRGGGAAAAFGGHYAVSPHAPNTPENNVCKLMGYRGVQVASFVVCGRPMICLPQAFDLFLKNLVGGLHTVYTKLKRLEIVPVVCNVEQVRILRGLGAIQPGVNRCKLLAPHEFDILYEDCTTSSARPGRPPKRTTPAGVTCEVTASNDVPSKLPCRVGSGGFEDVYSRSLEELKHTAALTAAAAYQRCSQQNLIAAAAAAAARMPSFVAAPYHPALVQQAAMSMAFASRLGRLPSPWSTAGAAGGLDGGGSAGGASSGVAGRGRAAAIAAATDSMSSFSASAEEDEEKEDDEEDDDEQEQRNEVNSSGATYVDGCRRDGQRCDPSVGSKRVRRGGCGAPGSRSPVAPTSSCASSDKECSGGGRGGGADSCSADQSSPAQDSLIDTSEISCRLTEAIARAARTESVDSRGGPSAAAAVAATAAGDFSQSVATVRGNAVSLGRAVAAAVTSAATASAAAERAAAQSEMSPLLGGAGNSATTGLLKAFDLHKRQLVAELDELKDAVVAEWRAREALEKKLENLAREKEIFRKKYEQERECREHLQVLLRRYGCHGGGGGAESGRRLHASLLDVPARYPITHCLTPASE